MAKVLVASVDNTASKIVGDALPGRSDVHAVKDVAAFTSLMADSKESRSRFEFLFLELDLLETWTGHAGYSDYSAALKSVRKRFPGTEVIIMSPPEKVRQAVKVVKAGADDYVTCPIESEEVVLVVETIRQERFRQLELEHLRNAMSGRDSTIVGTASPLMQEVFRQVDSVAPTRSTVLLCGETGTGKGVVAKLIHARSNRAAGPFIMVHCGAIPETLIESELFGHERGAFTGADRRKAGKFEIAKSGTVFLDEVSTISHAAQVKLLQVLQEHSFYRVGGETPVETDVRIIAATNEELADLIKQGKFRQDLYYRLNVFPIALPPLRDRLEDIPMLAEGFLRRLDEVHGKGIRGIDPRVIEAFNQYSWPGNVRELENVLERAYILENTRILTPESFPTELLAFPSLVSSGNEKDLPSLNQARRRSLEMVERQYLREILTLYQGRIGKSAQTAGISPRQLHNLMTKYGFRKEDFK